MVKALKLWGEGKKTPDVIKGAFGVSPQDYDSGYRAWQLARLATTARTWDELLEIGSWSKAREVGKLRVEGKDYEVADGDVLEFRFNV